MGKASRNKQGRRRIEASREALVDRVRSEGPWAGAAVQSPEAGEARLSQVLTEFARPYLDGAGTAEACREVMVAAITAWNFSLLSEPQRLDALGQVQREESVDTRIRLEGMIVRKLRFFGMHRRYVVDFSVGWQEGRLHLSVLSAPAG
ncbi:MAG TPA: hypothetical protein PKM73_07615 [Verrucomicrobiota bacterium]|nr:hypothetical protein [Verrucomicrobiota bacterium]HNU51191.1 hypothetical protein [Verrucomicrobiota bacterium]